MTTPETVEAMWVFGHVVEDRWGLRWRADIVADGSGRKCWHCRSVGLRIWRTHETMADRGPLTFIRHDRVSGGPDAKAARESGETTDAAVTVDGATAEDTDPADTA